MPLSEKAERVSLQFERFSKICKCVPVGEVEILEDTGNDPPDVSIGGVELGIEFTDFYRDSKQKGETRFSSLEK